MDTRIEDQIQTRDFSSEELGNIFRQIMKTPGIKKCTIKISMMGVESTEKKKM